jgi:hypothetical protein
MIRSIRNFTVTDSALVISVRLALTCCLLAVLLTPAQAQSAARPDRGVRPVGSYSVSDIENISLTNGNVNLSIPLASLPPVAGGSLNWTIRAEYSSKLWDRIGQEWGPVPPAPGYTEHTLQLGDTGGWRTGGIYRIDVYSQEQDFQGLPPESSNDPEYYLTGYRWKMVLTTPDGAKHELRPTDYSSYPGNLDYRRGYYKDTPRADSINATMRYYSVDGSYLWAKINPYPIGGGPTSWTVYLPDGTTVEQSSGIQRIKDTNGNKIKIWSDVAGTVSTTHYRDEQTGREIKHSYDSATSTGQVQYQTVGGTWVTIDINWGTTRVFGQTYLSGDLCNTEKLVDTDISVIRSIVLPLTKPGASRQQYKYLIFAQIGRHFINEGLIDGLC